jgi:hypothetical protein
LDGSVDLAASVQKAGPLFGEPTLFKGVDVEVEVEVDSDVVWCMEEFEFFAVVPHDPVDHPLEMAIGLDKHSSLDNR